MYVIDLHNLMPEYEKIKSILLSSLGMNVVEFDCRTPGPYPTGETIFCCEKKYLTNRLEAFLVLFNWYVHDNEDWKISQSDESTINYVLDSSIIPALRGFNLNFFDCESGLEGVSRSMLNNTNAWESNKFVGKIISEGVAQEVTDFGKSFKNMLGEPKSCATLERSWSGNLYLYETSNCYALHEFWAVD